MEVKLKIFWGKKNLIEKFTEIIGTLSIFKSVFLHKKSNFRGKLIKNRPENNAKIKLKIMKRVWKTHEKFTIYRGNLKMPQKSKNQASGWNYSKKCHKILLKIIEKTHK